MKRISTLYIKREEEVTLANPLGGSWAAMQVAAYEVAQIALK